MTSSESSLKQSKLSSAYKTIRSFISIGTIYQHKRIFINSSVTHFLSFTPIRNIRKCKKTSINSFITHFLGLIAIGNKFYCRVRSIDSFITQFLSYVATRDNVLNITNSNIVAISKQYLMFEQHFFFDFYFNHYVVRVILLDIKDELQQYILLNYCWYIYSSQSLQDLSI